MKEEARQYCEMAKQHLVAANASTAEYYFLKSMELDENAEALFGLGRIRAADKNRGAAESALRYYERSYQLSGGDFKSAYECARIHYGAGRYHEAVSWFHKCLLEKGAVDTPQILYSLALIYLSWNRPERSRRYLNMALRRQKGFQKARLLLAVLEP